MTIGIHPQFGRPGIGTAQLAQRRNVSRNGALDYYPAGGVIKGSKARDPGNSAYSTRALRAGLLVGKITSGGYWANSVLGLSQGALAVGATTINVPVATAVEIVRRIGTSGTFKLTGPPTAAGVVKTLTVTFSAVNTTTGDITITALGTNQVDQINFNAASTAGNLQLRVQKTDGTFVTTGNAAWSGTDATYLGNINTALDTATGVVGGIVASAIPSVDPDLGIRLTYSGTGYAGLAWVPATVAVFPTSSTIATYQNIAAAVDGRFVTLSLVQPTDGSETIRSVIGDGYGLVIPDDDSDINFPLIPCAGTLDVGTATDRGVIDWPSDASLKTYVEQQLSTLGGGKWIFSDQF